MYIIWNWTIIQGTTLEMIMKNDPLYQVLEIPMSDWKKLVQTTSYITIFDIFLRSLPRGRFAFWGQLEVINYILGILDEVGASVIFFSCIRL